jgi:hypothetical protein
MQINIPDRKWAAVNPQRKPVQRAFKGVDRNDPYSISDDHFARVKNLSSRNAPAASTRPGFTVLGGYGTRVTGLSAWKNQQLHAVFNDGIWRRWDGTTWTDVKTGLNTSADWSFVNFKGGFADTNLIGTNGVDPAQRYDGATAYALSDAPAGANYINQHDNRLYCAVGNKVQYSGINLPEQWTLSGRPDASSPGTVRRETYVGENIIGMQSGAGHLTVFFPSSSHELFGTSSSDFEMIAVAEDFGAINNQGITNLGGVLYFVDETGIYAYTGGVRPRKEFSQPVQPYIDNMNKTLKQQCCAGSDGRYLYIAIPIGVIVDTVLVWDSQEDTWYVWEDLQLTHFCKMGELLYAGDAQGRVLQFGGNTDDGNPIEWEAESKVYTGQSMSQTIEFIKVWLSVEKPVGADLNVWVSKSASGNDWTLVGELSASVSVNNRVPIIPYNVARGNTLRYKLTGTGQVTIREITVEIKEIPL